MFARGGRWLCAAALVAYALVVVIPAARDPHRNGFAAYYTASRILIDTPADLPRAYDDDWFQARIDALGFAHVLDACYQPPTVSLMLAPVAPLPLAPARAIWIFACVLFWLGGLAVLAGAVRPVWALAALTCVYVPIADNLRQGQAYTLLFFLLCLVFRFARDTEARRHWLAGVPLGLMLVLKAAGFWLWPMLLVSRRWRVVAGAAATALVVAVAAGPWISWSAWEPFLRDLPRWASNPIRCVTAFQTINSVTCHLFSYDSRWNLSPLTDVPLLAAGLTIAVTAAVLVASARVQQLESADSGLRTVSLGMLAAPVNCLAPYSEGHAYVLVLPSLLVALWWAARRGATFRSWSILATSAVLLVVPVRFLVTRFLQEGWLALLAYPRVYGALLLWGWLAAVLRRSPRTAPDRISSGAEVGPRIAIVSPTFEPNADGVEALLERYHALTGWAGAVAAAGAGRVDVVQRFTRDLTLCRDGVNYHFVSDRGRPPTSRWYCGHAMVNKVSALQPDLVHVEGLVFPLLVRNLRLGLTPRIAVVAQDHGGIHAGSAGFRRPAWRTFHRLGLRAADGFLFTTRALADPWIRSRIFHPDQEIHEVPESSMELHLQGASEDSGRSLPGRPAILWVGRLDANKDPLTVLDGFEHAQATLPDAELTMVFGDDYLLTEVRSRIAVSAALTSRVHLRGAVPRSALPALYRGADIFVLGSHHESGSFALIEALSFGVTPVVTRIPAFTALIGDGQVGAFYEPGDPDGLAGALVRLGGANASSRRELVRQHFSRELSWPAVGAKALAIYRRVIASRSAVPSAR